MKQVLCQIQEYKLILQSAERMREVGAALSIEEEQQQEEEKEEEEEEEEKEQRKTYFVLSLVSEVNSSKPCIYCNYVLP